MPDTTQQAEDVNKLQERIKPYLLRRMKEDVEKAVPPKEETIIEVLLADHIAGDFLAKHTAVLGWRAWVVDGDIVRVHVKTSDVNKGGTGGEAESVMSERDQVVQFRV